ncbi:Metallo-dependent phosphatase-like protein [Poronia punctata]|nr:Metallo-dependent phosphatase-like protein [Poronia punctata]
MEHSTTEAPNANPQGTRRTRFVCIADTHNCTVKLPKGDVLIHCGDLTNQGGYKELSKQVKWLEEADFELKIVIAGNHDLTLDSEFQEAWGQYRHDGSPYGAEDCQALLADAKTLTYMVHESRSFKLTSSTGPKTMFSVFASPYSPAWGGAWAFQYPRDDDLFAETLWEEIPLDTDVVITHGPARTHLDLARASEASGCEILRQQLWRVRPRLALCGHIHEARGAERVLWDLDSDSYGELERTPWADPDPDSEKNALVDLTAKCQNPLDNDGSYAETTPTGGPGGEKTDQGDELEEEVEKLNIEVESLRLGKAPELLRKDREALTGRFGRKETCFINCSIQHTSYPHLKEARRRFNKPIVVDLDLPIWAADDTSEPAPGST